MALSFMSYPADGTQTDFQVTFDYLDESHVRVRVDKVYTDEVGSGYKFEWLNHNTVRVTTVIDSNPVPAGTQVDLIRRTPINTPAVIFGGGASLTSANLNKNSEYLTFALQEATDANEEFTKLYLGAFDEAPTSDNDGDALQIGAVYYDSVIKALFYWTGDGWIVGESTFAAETSRLAAEAAQVAAEEARDAAGLSAVNAASSEGVVVSLSTQVSQDAVETENARSVAVSAKDASESARVSAVAAESNAVAAQGGAETARVAAEIARDAAGASRDASAVSANNAAASEDAAALSETNAASSAAAAQAAEGSAAVSAAAAAMFDPNVFYNKIEADGRFPKIADNALPDGWRSTQAQAEAGTDNDKAMTALRVSEAIAAFAPDKPTSPTVVSITTGFGTPFYLPAGGTWFVYATQISSSGTFAFVQVCDVFAGGTTIGTPGPLYAWTGFAWRIS